MLISFIFSYSENFFVVFHLSFYFVRGQDPSAGDPVFTEVDPYSKTEEGLNAPYDWNKMGRRCNHLRRWLSRAKVDVVCNFHYVEKKSQPGYTRNTRRGKNDKKDTPTPKKATEKDGARYAIGVARKEGAEGGPQTENVLAPQVPENSK